MLPDIDYIPAKAPVQHLYTAVPDRVIAIQALLSTSPSKHKRGLSVVEAASENVSLGLCFGQRLHNITMSFVRYLPTRFN